MNKSFSRCFRKNKLNNCLSVQTAGQFSRARGMVSESRRIQDRDRQGGHRRSFDLLQICLIFALLLIIGSVIFSAFTVRMELNRTHQLRHKSDERLKNLERRVKDLTLLRDKELALRKWKTRTKEQLMQPGMVREL